MSEITKRSRPALRPDGVKSDLPASGTHPPVTLRLVLRYVAFQLPELSIVGCLLVLGQQWGALSAWTAGVIFALWVVKDIVLFPMTRLAYAPGDGRSSREILGAVGVAHEGLEDSAYVRIGPELWRARRASGCRPIAPGGLIRVVALEGLTVLVEGYSDEGDS
jgi:membrane protein implicated in regulation of membrane protease activity